eukprot:CAMPEP_0113264638 /NCGR_PEP_ID=MMETSP0008_2-20120614/19078_1 /TAXON_ID=97485 /ORGANISM="Prymnesium parvum" /LENGTH=52 /DNA_ID=CAMNT_0000113409 /DNA_START=21 /DNA_END=175 /DNA_ORIENTATION=- /assembly_acc=CAM_ASM_000153
MTYGAAISHRLHKRTARSMHPGIKHVRAPVPCRLAGPGRLHSAELQEPLLRA